MKNEIKNGKILDSIISVSLFAVLGSVLLFGVLILINTMISRKIDEDLWETHNYCRQCPICGNTIDIDHSSELYYIKCDSNYGGCGLRTGYYNSIDDLINDWNMLCNYNK
jgi:hypothetical protein